MAVRITAAVEKVLGEMLADPGGHFYGLQLSRATGLKSGTLYPVLSRLEGEGFVVSEWEDIDPATEERPARRYYRLTGAGVLAANRIAVELAHRARFRLQGAEA